MEPTDRVYWLACEEQEKHWRHHWAKVNDSGVTLSPVFLCHGLGRWGGTDQ